MHQSIFFVGTKVIKKCLNGLFQRPFVKSDQVTRPLNGFWKIWWMVKGRTLYLNPKENGTFFKFWRILLGQSLKTPF